MIIAYNNGLFYEIAYSETTGDNSDVAQSFYANVWVNTSSPKVEPFAFDVPLYTTLGGTFNYYGQDYYSIYTNINRPTIKFTFTANTDSFGTGVSIVHKLYKLPYQTYLEYLTPPETQDLVTGVDKEIETKTIEKIDPTTNKSISKETIKTTKSTDKNNQIFTTSDFYETPENKHQEIIDLLTNPYLTTTGQTSAITGYEYYYFIDEYHKNLGEYQKQVFTDKAQYFLETGIGFIRNQKDYEKFYIISGGSDNNILSGDNKIVEISYNSVVSDLTIKTPHIITGGTFSGISVNGKFFTYFLIPNKPAFETPLVEGTLSTFAPTFYWTNGDDADEYLLQITYGTGGSQNFTGTVYSYPITKEESNLNTNELLGLKDPGTDFSIAQETTDVIRKYSVPLLPGEHFYYRIGNVKSIVNIFGVKQSVVSFSDEGEATTDSAPFKTFVQTLADSPHTDEVLPYRDPGYLSVEEELYFLSGTVTGSIVTGATIQLTYPNSQFITQPTDSVGGYRFDNLGAGSYTLTTSYRGYAQDVRVINITGNTYESFKVNLVWGNKYDTWGQLANENYYT